MAWRNNVMAFWKSRNKGIPMSYYKSEEQLQEIITTLKEILSSANFEGSNGVSLIMQPNAKKSSERAPDWYLNAVYEEGAPEEDLPFVVDEPVAEEINNEPTTEEEAW